MEQHALPAVPACLPGSPLRVDSLRRCTRPPPLRPLATPPARGAVPPGAPSRIVRSPPRPPCRREAFVSMDHTGTAWCRQPLHASPLPPQPTCAPARRKEAFVSMDHENAFGSGPVRCVSASTYLRLRFLDSHTIAEEVGGRGRRRGQGGGDTFGWVDARGGDGGRVGRLGAREVGGGEVIQQGTGRQGSEDSSVSRRRCRPAHLSRSKPPHPPFYAPRLYPPCAAGRPPVAQRAAPAAAPPRLRAALPGRPGCQPGVHVALCVALCVCCITCCSGAH